MSSRLSRLYNVSLNTDKPPQDPPELDHYDDKVLEGAFRWSLITLAVLLGLGGAGFWYVKARRKAGPSQMTLIAAPQLPPATLAEIPTARFTDITRDAGIDFVHYNGATGEKLLPETMGGGVAFLDFDNDGDQDLLFANSMDWPWAKLHRRTTPALYRNDGKGRFQNVTASSGLDVSFYGMGVAVGDYDNDDLPDVFLTGVGESKLFHNEGAGRFRQAQFPASTNWSTSAAFIDYDNDGDLDLFVCNYVRWSREIDFEVNYRLTGIGRAYGPPMNFEGTFPGLYRNEGQGRFTDVSGESGIQITNSATGRPVAKSLAVAPVDADNDGWIDLVVANDTVQNFLFNNQRNGTFKEIGARSGVAFDAYGLARGAMGIDSARFRNDDSLGIAIGNFANEMNALYVSQRDSLMFADEAITEGVGPASRLLLKFGLFFFDYDLDGRLDVLTANGHLEEEINKIQQSQQYRQPAQLFWNRGAARGVSFVPVPPTKAGGDLFKPMVARGSAFADIDNDGDLDVVITQIAGPPLLLRNDQQLGHNWLRLKLVGRTSNRDAIGAWIKVRAGNHTLSRQVMPARSYLSHSELPVTIGLGKLAKVDAVEIFWPRGVVQKLVPKPNTSLTIVEPASP